jgi:hypothetical protein
LADPTQVRAWTRRLAISADSLKAVIDKVGNSVAAVTKEVELRGGSSLDIAGAANREPA